MKIRISFEVDVDIEPDFKGLTLEQIREKFEEEKPKSVKNVLIEEIK